MSTGRRKRRGDQGSASVELAVITAPLLVLFALLIAAGRIALSKGAIEGVATSAARQASLARTPTAARHAAEDTARKSLTDQHLNCQHTTVKVDTSGFAVPLGQPANLRVEVTCTACLSDLALPGLPGTTTLRDSFTSPLDPYRGRQQ